MVPNVNGTNYRGYSMATERLVKWGETAKRFFEDAGDNSIVLDLVISYACASQTGEGFEELINTINSESIKRKVKKVNITDTSYLYRHDNPEFSKYFDATIPTEWFLNNREAIEKLEVPKEVKSWATDINTTEFQKWDKKIKIDFAGDEKGLNINKEFREKVLQEANLWTMKSGAELKQSLGFVLEECAHACAFLNSAVVAYPGKPTNSLTKAMQIDGKNFVCLDYKISDHAQRQKKRCKQNSIMFDIVDKEIVLFMKEKVSNVNFFLVDKNGDPIYTNYALEKVVDHANVKSLDQKAWENAVQVMRDKKEYVVEEVSSTGKNYLSVKSPLYDKNENVIGIIGVSVDITERKIARDLENKLKIEQELYTIAKEVAHDIASPVSSLKAVEYVYKEKLGANDVKMLTLAISSIENMSKKLMEKYRIAKNFENGIEEPKREEIDDVAFDLYKSLTDILETKRYQYEYTKADIKLNFYPDKNHEKVYIKGDESNFSRMMSNLVNNSAEAFEGEPGVIDISYVVEGEKGDRVTLIVKDTGKGMPPDMVEKIMRGVEVNTTKCYGHGIGMEQIKRTIKSMKGRLAIKSQRNESTEFMVTFPKA
jgi:signal transduction histidine kinase